MWLVEKSVKEHLDIGYHAYAMNPSAFAVQYSAFMGRDESFSSIVSVIDGVAQIDVLGTLTNKPDFISMLFGGGNTTYSEIISAIRTADLDPAISKIILNIDSGGGQVSGLFELIDTIKSTSTDIIAVSSNAGSAAYAIAAATDRIIAVNRSSMFGSVGVASSYYVDESVVDIASTEAPNKRPDVTKESGIESVRATLDSIHELFATELSLGRSLATGKNITVKKVNTDFGRGSMLLANDAINAGMVDEIQAVALPLNVVNGANSAKQTNAETIMDANKLKAEFPQVYADIKKEAVAEERDRVSAMLIAGEKSGDMARAVKAINDGEQMNSTLSTHFMMAAVSNAEIVARAKDGVVDVVTGSDNVDADKLLAAALGAELGVA